MNAPQPDRHDSSAEQRRRMIRREVARLVAAKRAGDAALVARQARKVQLALDTHLAAMRMVWH